MPAKNTKKCDVPRLCQRLSPNGKPLLYATFHGRMVSFGPAGPEGRRRYDEFVAHWLANGRRYVSPASSPDEADYRIDDLVADFLEHASSYYVDAGSGEVNREFGNLKTALAPMLEIFRELPARKFGPLALQQLRQQLLDTGRYCRKEINARMHRIRRAFRWAVAQERLPGDVLHSLKSVEGLKAGRSGARDSEPVRPVQYRHVIATLPHLPTTVATMVKLQALTGARPDEICGLRMRHIDRSGAVWLARLDRHKNAWRGHTRTLRLDSHAQELLRPYLRPAADAFLFSPALSEQERHERQREQRRTKVQPSQMQRALRAANRDRKRAPRECYDVNSYRQAIQRACATASAAGRRAAVLDAIPASVRHHFGNVIQRLPIGLTEPRLVAALASAAARHRLAMPHGWIDAAVGAFRGHVDEVPAWAPNQLRHAAATIARKLDGLDGSQVLLGHRKADVTQVYAELEDDRGVEVAQKVGAEIARLLRIETLPAKDRVADDAQAQATSHG